MKSSVSYIHLIWFFLIFSTKFAFIYITFHSIDKKRSYILDSSYTHSLFFPPTYSYRDFLFSKGREKKIYTKHHRDKRDYYFFFIRSIYSQQKFLQRAINFVLFNFYFPQFFTIYCKTKFTSSYFYHFVLFRIFFSISYFK